MKDRYKNYEDALKILKLDNLEVRKDKLTLNLAKSSLKIQKMNKLFPLNEKHYEMTKRKNAENVEWGGERKCENV